MRKNIFLLIFLIIILLFVPLYCSAKYVISSNSYITFSVSIDTSYPELSIADINGIAIEDKGVAIEEVVINFSGNIQYSYYKYSEDYINLEDSDKKPLISNQVFNKTGFYEIEVINKNENSVKCQFEIRKAVCKDENNIYYLALSDALMNRRGEESIITILNNLSEDEIVDYSSNVTLNLNSFTLNSSFDVRAGSELSISGGNVIGSYNNPTFIISGVLNILNGKFTENNSNVIHSSAGTINILGGTLVSSSTSPVINSSSSTIRIEDANIIQEKEGSYKAINFGKGLLEISGNSKIVSNGLAIFATNGSEIVLNSGVLNGIITVIGGTSSLKILKNTKVEVNTSASAITTYHYVEIDGGEIVQKGEGPALYVSGGIANIINGAVISGRGEHTLCSGSNTAVVNISNSTIINNNEGFAIYKHYGTVNVENSNIIGKEQY